MKRLIGAIAALFLLAGPAFAAAPVTPVDTNNIPLGTSGNPLYTTAGTPTGANVSITPTIQNASYVSGNCMGGFQTVATGTSTSVLNAITLASKGGLATAKQVYIFSANPSASTCTDKGTFTINSADVSKVIATTSITPAAPTGTTITFGTASSLGYGIPSGGTVYIAIVETTTETPASVSDLILNVTAF
jgi:hypothetical protein